MNILVIGSGGREHAICLKFSQSKNVDKIYAIPGNAGIEEIAKCVTEIDVKDHGKVIEFCTENKIDLVFVGPEQPLVDGIVDDLQNAGLRAFGPNKFASQLEGSKDFMKNITAKNNVPTAEYASFEDSKSAIKYAKSLGYPCVIKTDGLAAGKGVIIAQDEKEANETIVDLLENKRFGEAGNKIIVEEFLEGVEVSYFVICDQNSYKYIGSANDHKKVGDGETGPNTGGMGAFTPSPYVDDKLEEQINATIIEPTLEAFKKEGSPFCGILFAGIIFTKDGPKLLEFNTRFGDPETQVILPTIKNDFAQLINSAIDNKLDEVKIEFDKGKKCICVVIASNGYPGNYQKNIPIDNINQAQAVDNSYLIHAGTKEVDGKIVSNGGRVLNVIASADSFKDARKYAYEVIRVLDWKGGFTRTDIARSSSLV